MCLGCALLCRSIRRLLLLFFLVSLSSSSHIVEMRAKRIFETISFTWSFGGRGSLHFNTFIKFVFIFPPTLPLSLSLALSLYPCCFLYIRYFPTSPPYELWEAHIVHTNSKPRRERQHQKYTTFNMKDKRSNNLMTIAKQLKALYTKFVSHKCVCVCEYMFHFMLFAEIEIRNEIIQRKSGLHSHSHSILQTLFLPFHTY